MPEQPVAVWRLPHLSLSFRMMGGALVGSLISTAAVAGVALALAGTTGAVSALLGSVAVIAFLGGGSPVQLAAMGQGTQQAVGIVLISYVSRVAMLGLVLLALGPGRSHWDPHPQSVVAAVVATSLAWIVGLVVTHMRANVPVYDTEYIRVPEGGE
ncbi:hypothetical protein [Luteococcus sp. OSA5]|uniref:hypothetical protein n=1 Tax=Luteococcus sp. OSA5 TaxID=3401630 RepID=UPI003B43509F